MKLYSDFDTFFEGPFQESYFNEKLRTYIKNLWEDPAEYKVLMARRMLNLNDALMQEWMTDEKEQYLTDGIMSNTAFLLSAKAIADQYIYRKRLPRILICDDIMLHGRGILNLLDKFKSILKRQCSENRVEISDWQLDNDISRAISIYLFVCNQEGSLLIDQKKYRLFATQILPMNRLRELSLQISDFLQNRGTANTSYVISVRLSPGQLQDLSDFRYNRRTAEFQYKGRRQSIYFKNRSSHILETMRLYYPGEDESQGGILTSLPVFGDFSADHFSSLCKIIALFMEESFSNSQIAKYLRQEDTELAKPKAQLLSFLYSVLSLCDFCREMMGTEKRELYRILNSGDLNKIISNFDKGDIFKYEIFQLIKNICEDRAAWQNLWVFLEREAGTLRGELESHRTIIYNSRRFRYVNGPGQLRRREIYEAAEDLFYAVGMDAEYDANRCIRTGMAFNTNSPGFDIITFRNYLNAMWDTGGEYSICCLLGLMDSGLISMNFEASGKGKMMAVRTVLKAGEMATYVIPRRFLVFIPAFAQVESHYEDAGISPKEGIIDFVDYLQDFCFESGGRIDPRDKYLLEELQKKKPLILYLYSAGQKFEDWNINLKNERIYQTGRMVRDEDEMSEEEEQVRKKHYLFAASRFLKEAPYIRR